MTGKGTSRIPRDKQITTTDEKALHAVCAYHYLTAEQLCRLRYSPGSLNYAREQLKTLHDRGFLERLFGPRAQPAGSTPWVYVLAKRGVRFLKDVGIEFPSRYRPPGERGHAHQFLFHTLAINDVLIAAELLARSQPAIDLAATRHDLDLKHTPVTVTTARTDPRTGTAERTAVIPDGWMDFRVTVPEKSKPVPMPILLELDRGTKKVADFKKKIRALVAYIAGPYERVFGIRAVTVAFILDAAAYPSPADSARRLADMVRWTEEELIEIDRPAWGSSFAFTTLPVNRSFAPADLFLAPTCRGALSDLPLALLDLPIAATTRADGRSMPFLAHH